MICGIPRQLEPMRELEAIEFLEKDYEIQILKLLSDKSLWMSNTILQLSNVKYGTFPKAPTIVILS